MRNRVIVTGGMGFIGRNLVKKLSNEGRKVIVLDNFSRSSVNQKFKSDIESVNVDFLSVDILNFQDLNSIVFKGDTVYHLAAINGTKNFYNRPLEVLEVGVIGAINVAKICLAKEARKLIIFSSSEVYGTPDEYPTSEEIPYFLGSRKNPRYSYGIGKIVSEYVSSYISKEIPTAIIRPHNVYGPNMGYDHVIPELLMKLKKEIEQKKERIQLEIQGSGFETRAYCYIDDFLKALDIVNNTSESNEIFNIGSGEEISIFNLVQEMGKIINREIVVTPNLQMKQEGSTDRRIPNIEKILELGYRQSVSLDEGLKHMIRNYIGINI
jgi:UDP-glucose 4-epimerase